MRPLNEHTTPAKTSRNGIFVAEPSIHTGGKARFMEFSRNSASQIGHFPQQTDPILLRELRSGTITPLF
jgi:hypothetical protein